MKYISRHVRIWAICLLSVFATYYGAVMLFAHVHVVNGVMLVHSHPFNKQHTHAGGQALTLHFLSTFSTIEPEMAHWVTPVCPVFMYCPATWICGMPFHLMWRVSIFALLLPVFSFKILSIIRPGMY